MRGDGRLFLRGTLFWVEYWRNGRQFRESAKTEDRGEARKFLRHRVRESRGDDFVGPEEKRVRFGELLDVLVIDYQVNGRRSKIEHKLKRIREVFGDDLAVNVTAARIEAYKLARLQEGAANATVNRELSALKRAFRLAVKRRVLRTMPVVDLLREENARTGFVEPAEFESVVKHLPDVLADFARFAYGSAWRKSEVAYLAWSDVDVEGRIARLRPENAKTGEGRFVALEGALWDVIARRWAVRSFTKEPDGAVQLAPFVFHRGGKAIRRFEDAWKTAREKAGCPSLLFHDLRRSGIRNLVRAGVPERVAMSISGHKTRSVFDRYNVTSERDIREALVKAQNYVREHAGDPRNLVTIAGAETRANAGSALSSRQEPAQFPHNPHFQEEARRQKSGA